MKKILQLMPIRSKRHGIKIRSYALVIAILALAIVGVIAAQQTRSQVADTSLDTPVESSGQLSEQIKQSEALKARLSALKMHNAMRFTRVNETAIPEQMEYNTSDVNPAQDGDAVFVTEQSEELSKISQKVAQWESAFLTTLK